MNTNSVDFFRNESVKMVPDNCELIIAAWKIKNPENMGHIIRMGHNIGAKKVLFIDDNKNHRESKIKKTAGFSIEQQNWEIINEEFFFTFLNNSFELVILETCDGSKNIYETVLPKKTILLGGNESYGLPNEVLLKSKIKIHIPMQGGCKSMNISHALTVAAFEWIRQMSY